MRTEAEIKDRIKYLRNLINVIDINHDDIQIEHYIEGLLWVLNEIEE